MAYLLISAAAALRHRRAHDFEPFSRAARGEGNTADEFAALLGEEQRALRWWVYCQARDALGVPAPVAGGSPVAEAVVGSDEACIAAIRELPVPKRGE